MAVVWIILILYISVVIYYTNKIICGIITGDEYYFSLYLENMGNANSTHLLQLDPILQIAKIYFVSIELSGLHLETSISVDALLYIISVLTSFVST
jgi:hypothetical protein